MAVRFRRRTSALGRERPSHDGQSCLSQPAVFMNPSAAIAVFENRIPCGLFLRARIMLRALDLASAVTMHLDAVARRPGRRVRRSVGQLLFQVCLPSSRAPRACLAWRPRNVATNRHESCGLEPTSRPNPTPNVRLSVSIRPYGRETARVQPQRRDGGGRSFGRRCGTEPVRRGSSRQARKKLLMACDGGDPFISILLFPAGRGSLSCLSWSIGMKKDAALSIAVGSRGVCASGRPCVERFLQR